MNKKTELFFRVVAAGMLLYLLIKLFSTDSMTKTDRILSICFFGLLMLGNFNILKSVVKRRSGRRSEDD